MRKIKKNMYKVYIKRDNYTFVITYENNSEKSFFPRGENYYKSPAGLSSSSLSTSSTGFYHTCQNVVGSSQVEGLDADVGAITSGYVAILTTTD